MEDGVSSAFCSLCQRLVDESSEFVVVIVTDVMRTTICLRCVDFLNSLRLDNGKRLVPVRPATYVVRDWAELDAAIDEIESSNPRRDV